MKIIYHKHFLKSFRKLSSKEKELVKTTIKLFTEDPFDKNLRNHALQGKLQDKRSITVKGDLRIIFIEEKDYLIIIMLDLGKHSKVYK